MEKNLFLKSVCRLINYFSPNYYFLLFMLLFVKKLVISVYGASFLPNVRRPLTVLKFFEEGLKVVFHQELNPTPKPTVT